MDELNGRMIAAQLMLAGLIARVANATPDPYAFLTDFRDEMHAVVSQIRIAGSSDASAARDTARATVDELFSLMKAPSAETQTVNDG